MIKLSPTHLVPNTKTVHQTSLSITRDITIYQNDDRNVIFHPSLSIRSSGSLLGKKRPIVKLFWDNQCAPSKTSSRTQLLCSPPIRGIKLRYKDSRVVKCSGVERVGGSFELLRHIRLLTALLVKIARI